MIRAIIAVVLLADLYSVARFGLRASLLAYWNVARPFLWAMLFFFGALAFYLLVSSFFSRIVALKHYRAEVSQWNR